MRLSSTMGYPKKVLVALGMVAACVGLDLAVGVGPASAAPAIHQTPNCTDPGYLRLTAHPSGEVNRAICWADAGETIMPEAADTWYLTDIDTGNNRVQWYGDGKWQPDQPIGKNTHYGFPNTPGGVQIERIRILSE